MKQKVIIFGAGNCGMLIANSIKENHEILCFVDNDTTKHGNKVYLDQNTRGGGYLFIIQR